MNKFKIIVGGIIIIAVIMIIVGIIMINKEDNIQDEIITENMYIEQVEDIVIENDIVYNTDNMILISDYDTFYTLEKIVKEIVNDIYNEEYNDILKTVSKEFFAKKGKNGIKEKLENFNKIITSESYNISEYSRILYQVYERNSNEYDCLLNVKNDIHYLLIYLNKDNMTYEIHDFILSEEIK